MLSSRASAPASSICRAIAHPAAARRAVQAGDDRDAHRRLRLADVFQVTLGSQVVVRHVGKVTSAPRESFPHLVHRFWFKS